jgi:hypothetical protein
MVKHHTVYLVVGISVVTFLLGLYFGSLISLTKVNSLELRDLSFESIALEYGLIQNFDSETCPYLDARQKALFDDLAEIGRIISHPATEKELSSQEFDFLKRRYHLTQIRSYLQDMRLNSDCELDRNTILFYYQNPSSEAEYLQNKQFFDQSVAQGYILDDVVDSFGGWESVTVYAIEFNYSRELSFLEEYFNITTSPSLVINFQHVFSGFTEKDVLIPLLQ